MLLDSGIDFVLREIVKFNLYPLLCTLFKQRVIHRNREV